MFYYNQSINDNEKYKEESKDFSSILTEKSLKSRTIFISGEINQELAEKVCTKLLILEELSDEPIKIFYKIVRVDMLNLLIQYMTSLNLLSQRLL